MAPPASPTEHDADRCGSEEESRGAEAEEEGGQQASPTGGAALATNNRLSKLSLSRIKTLMKTDPDVNLTSQESVLVIAKATVRQDWREAATMLGYDRLKRDIPLDSVHHSGSVRSVVNMQYFSVFYISQLLRIFPSHRIQSP